MIVNFKFKLFEKVLINDLDVQGTVVQLIINSNNLDEITCRVEYWWDGELKAVNLFEKELSPFLPLKKGVSV